MRRRLTEYLLEIWTGCHLSVQRCFCLQDSLFLILFLPCFIHFISTKVVRIFTSSTFTDMLMERNTLMEYVYPKIKEYCREKHGLEYQVALDILNLSCGSEPQGHTPKLKAETLMLVLKKLISVQVVDMRWGVRDEMTDEHMTTVSTN